MTKKIKKFPRQDLLTWLVRAPLMFGVICATLFTAMIWMGARPMSITMMTPFAFIIAGMVAVRMMRSAPLDRFSYVAIDNAVTIAPIAVSIILAGITPRIPNMTAWALNISGMLYALVLFGIFTLSYYLIGIVLANLYAVYLRCIKMGLSRWKIIMTMPFTTLYFPAYFLSDTSRARPVIDVHPSWFSRLTHWVVARPINAIILYGIMILINIVETPTIDNITFITVSAVLFGLYLVLTPMAQLRNNIGGLFTTASIFINIAFIIKILGGIMIG